MKTAFIICSRLDSSRVPGKALAHINGKPLLAHLLERLRLTSIDVIMAVPTSDHLAIRHALSPYGGERCGWFVGHDNDPLARTYYAAKSYCVDNVIRVCHDKIFIDPDQVFRALDVFNRRALDYLYSSKFIDGTAFEIISTKALAEASAKHKEVEFIGYAVRSVTDNVFDMDFQSPVSDARLLLDYPDDLVFLETLLTACGNDCTISQALGWLEKNSWAKRINRLPRVTVYTCAHNADRFIERCMGSVAKQKLFREMEYIIVDDHSTDKTTQLVSRFCASFKNSRWIRNQTNLGLASSSNVALKAARGRYIMRLDADDYFPANSAVAEMVAEIEATGKDVIIPNNYFGDYGKIQYGRDAMHIGGSIFRTRAVNHVKFTEGLRGYEGLDFFTRAREMLDIGYLNKPIFFYTQRADSMSKTNLEDRTRIKQDIMAKASKEGVPV